MPDNKPYLIVPVIIDALIERHGSYILSPLADFSLLPYVDRSPKEQGWRCEKRPGIPIEVGSDTAYISENIVPQPFGDQNFYLAPGVHLHWALPQGLTIGRHQQQKGEPSRTKIVFPCAPNRWRVVRTDVSDLSKTTGVRLPDRTWVVESDYLDTTGNAIAYPLVSPDPVGPPYYRLGRVIELPNGGQYQEDPAAMTLAKRQVPLTAMGWGDPYFHAFYPNCYSVFGLHDNDRIPDDREIVYTLTGWYSDPAIDPIKNACRIDQYGQPLSDQDGQRIPLTQAGFERDFGWKIEDASWEALKGAVPQGLICCGRVTVKVAPAEKRMTKPLDRVVIGNSGVEAMGAHLAHDCPAACGDRESREQSYACMTHLRALQDRRVDLEAQFEEERHSNGFTALAGGTLWTFRELPTEHEKPMNAAQGQMSLPLDLIDELDKLIHAALPKHLHRLNQYQLALDRGLDVIRSRRRQCYADWYKYMLCIYRPPHASRDHDYPPIDAIRRLLEADIAWLKLVEQFVQRPTVGSGVTPPVPDENTFMQVALVAREVLPQGSDLAADYSRAGVETRFLENRLQPLEELRDAEKSSLTALTGLAPLFRTRPASLDQLEKFDVSLLPPDVRTSFRKLVDHLTTHGNQTESVCAEVAGRLSVLELREVPAPRYWQPNEPTVLLAGEDADPSDRHDQEGPMWVWCKSLPENGNPPELAREFESHKPRNFDLKSLISQSLELNKPKPQLNSEQISTLVQEYIAQRNLKSSDKEQVTLENEDAGVAYYRGQEREVNAWALGEFQAWDQLDSRINRTSDGSHWHPLFLEWAVGVQPLQNGGNVPVAARKYKFDFVMQNFTLPESAVDLEPTNRSVTPSSSSFMGRSILTPHASRQVVRNTREFTEWSKTRETESPGVEGGRSKIASVAPANTSPLYQLQLLADATFALLEGRPLEYADVGAGALDASATQAGTVPVPQTQSLSGFNDALLMHRQTLQLPVADPLGFEDYRKFTETDVKDAVADQNLIAPELWFDFHPLRTGQMQIERLRLVDTFGQVREIDLGEVPLTTTDQLQGSSDVQLDSQHRIVPLPPRITQPARVNFRWLSAADDSQETNSHAVTSPVCGWVVPNNFDESLMIYDGQGHAIGSIVGDGTWRPAPGRELPSKTADIENPHLRQLAKWIQKQSNGNPRFVPDFIKVLDTALANIEPDTSAQHEALALLMGRPIALVRAFVNLELQGLPASHQSWDDLRRRLDGDPPDTDDFCDVKIPFRIGEHWRLNDGVVGYWLEGKDGYSPDQFFAPQSDHIELESGEKMFIYREDSENSLNFRHAINDPPQLITLLMDPRGLAHCTCGVLPTKSLSLPVEHTAGALRKIEVSFRTAPLLTTPGRVKVPLPTEPGYTWTWIQKDGPQWTKLSMTPTVEKAAISRAFPSTIEFPDRTDNIWKVLIAQGWIKERVGPADWPTAIVVLPKPKQPLSDKDQKDLKDLGVSAEDVMRVLEASQRVLSDVSQEARFGPAQEIREGWLELTLAENAGAAAVK